MRTVAKYFRNYLLQSILSPFFKLLEVVFELIVPVVVASIIDNGIKTGDTDYILKRIILLGIFALVGFASAICAQYFAAMASAGISSDIRSDLFNKIQKISVADFEKIGPGNAVTGLTSDVNQIQSGINLTLRLILRSPLIVCGAMIMAFTIDAKLALIFVVVIALLGAFVGLNMRSAIPSYKKTRKSMDDLVNMTDNGLNGVKVIRGFNRSSDDYSSFEKESRTLNILQKKAAQISAYLNPVTFLIVNIAICVLIYTGALRIDSGSLTQGYVVALYNYLSLILVELIKLANLIVSISRAIACASRVEDFMGYIEESVDNAILIEDPKKPHSLEFKDVTFVYQGNSEQSLGHVSFKVMPGETIGVIGKTGSGKSTVSLLASGVYPITSGQILIDDKPIDSIKREDLYKAVGVCLQKAKLFSGTLRYNISLDREYITDKDIAEAVDVSCVNEVVAGKDGGLDYVVSSNGTGLSGGQKQRIGIARTLAGHPGLIIFDDSTSALDSRTERQFLGNLNKITNRPTKLIISQKIRTIMNADKILLLEDGEAIAFAPHDELMKTSESYREIYRLQMGKEGEAV